MGVGRVRRGTGRGWGRRPFSLSSPLLLRRWCERRWCKIWGAELFPNFLRFSLFFPLLKAFVLPFLLLYFLNFFNNFFIFFLSPLFCFFLFFLFSVGFSFSFSFTLSSPHCVLPVVHSWTGSNFSHVTNQVEGRGGIQFVKVGPQDSMDSRFKEKNAELGYKH